MMRSSDRLTFFAILVQLQAAWTHESPSNPHHIFKRTGYGTPEGGYPAPANGWDDMSNYGGVNFNDPELYKGVFPLPQNQPNTSPPPAPVPTPPPPPAPPTPPTPPPSKPEAKASFESDSIPVIAQKAQDIVAQGVQAIASQSAQVPATQAAQATSSPSQTPSANGNAGTAPSDGQSDNGQCSKSTAQCPPGCQMNIKFTSDSLDVPFTPGAGGKSDQTTTKNACICMTGGSVRVNIGSNNFADHTTLVEGNAAGLNDNSFFDVSYVEGYSYPVVCWNDQDPTRMSGSNIDLYAHGKCSDSSKTKMGDICLNDGYMLLASGNPSDECWKCTLPSAFFAPAAGAAYAYPYDDCPCASDPEPGKRYSSPMANGGDLTCCVGPQCCANTMSHGGQTRKGNCNRPDCQPCQAGFSWGHCTAQCKPGANKRDYDRVLHQASLRKRHQHHQHHSH